MFSDDASVTTPTTSKAERRRSLPSRVSIASFSSDISALIAPTPTEASFQQRRRRAAKLTHFFGVDYRDLVNEILESIEKGLEEERGKGTLRPDEVKVRQRLALVLFSTVMPMLTALLFSFYPGSATEAGVTEDEAEQSRAVSGGRLGRPPALPACGTCTSLLRRHHVTTTTLMGLFPLMLLWDILFTFTFTTSFVLISHT